ncbi:hypothetical protein BGZ67_003380 [Mortierella alpina]|nr:hypothetical protein BGZ67_003380 [Mortierella alpina]
MRILWQNCTSAAVAAIAACSVFAVYAESEVARQDRRSYAIPQARQEIVDREEFIHPEDDGYLKGKASGLYSQGQPRPRRQFRQLHLNCGDRSIEQLNCPVRSDSITILGYHVVQENIFMEEPCRQHRQQPVRLIPSNNGRMQNKERSTRQRLERRRCVQRQRHKDMSKQQQHLRKQPGRTRQSYRGRCVATGLFCGSKLFGCSFGHEALYKCSAVGETPTLILADAKACLGGHQGSWALRAASSTFEILAADKCIHQCACPAGGHFCGSTFAPACKFHGLYRCGGSGEVPILVNDCMEGGGCTVNAGDDSCSSNICTCPSPGYAPVCGSQLPKDCHDAKLNTVYWCPGGSGTRPEVLEICKPGTQCQPKPLPDGALCGSNTCNCTGNNAICSNTFPSECRLEKNAIYKCTDEGAAELVVQCDATEVCVTTAGGSICVVPNCQCPGNGTVCGEIFPLSCRLKKTALFHCVQGQDPILKNDCGPLACTDSRVLFADTAVIFEVLAVSDQCADMCTCQGEDVICGETFPAECRLDGATLYSCKVQPNSVYRCSNSGVPELVEECLSESTCVVDVMGAICRSNECNCAQDSVLCGDVFPPLCDLKATALYTCRKGENPVFKADCYPNRCSVPLDLRAMSASFKLEDANVWIYLRSQM